MATAKLEIQATANVEKAKSRLAEIGKAAAEGANEAEGALSGVERAAEKAAAAMEKTAKGVQKTGEAAEVSGRAVVRMGFALASMGAGLAAKLAARAYGENSTAGAVAEYGGGIASGAGQGASIGMMVAGPKGAAIGAGIGAAAGGVNTYLERDKREEDKAKAEQERIAANKELVETFDKHTAQAREMRELFERLADTETDVADRTEEAQKRLDALKEEEDDLRATLALPATQKNQKAFAGTFAELQRNVAAQDAIAAVQKRLAAEEQKPAAGAFRKAFANMDSLAALGLAAGGPASRVQDQQLSELQKLNANVKRLDTRTKWL